VPNQGDERAAKTAPWPSTTESYIPTRSDRETEIERLSHLSDSIFWRLLQHSSARLQAHGLTLIQAAGLAALHNFGPEMEMQRVVAVTGLPASSVTSVFDRLVARGLVQRSPHVSDGRRVLASLTESGVDLALELRKDDLAWLEYLVHDLGDDTLRQVNTVLESWEERISKIPIGEGLAPAPDPTSIP
jgi:MarR family transcriptional regulator, lower aerobic nicotinate degradation pathway regulator